MHIDHGQILPVVLIFLLAGLVKGTLGMGLPTIAMGLLGLLMHPVDAAGLIVIPSLITNAWQFLSARHRRSLMRRTWPMLLTNCVATWAGAGLIIGAGAGHATLWLGASLVFYAALGLANVRLSVPGRHEVWLSPSVGAATGLVTGATGVFVVPAVPYLEVLGFERDELVAVLGLAFTVSTIALAAGLASRGVFEVAAASTSTLCTLPALAGMAIGRFLRGSINRAIFRRLFLLGLLLIGGNLMLISSG